MSELLVQPDTLKRKLSAWSRFVAMFRKEEIEPKVTISGDAVDCFFTDECVASLNSDPSIYPMHIDVSWLKDEDFV